MKSYRRSAAILMAFLLIILMGFATEPVLAQKSPATSKGNAAEKPSTAADVRPGAANASDIKLSELKQTEAKTAAVLPVPVLAAASTTQSLK